MTTCEDLTFERLLAHIDEPSGNPHLQQHIAGCDRCSARIAAVNNQSLALAALARGLSFGRTDTLDELERLSEELSLDGLEALEALETLEALDEFGELDEFDDDIESLEALLDVDAIRKIVDDDYAKSAAGNLPSDDLLEQSPFAHGPGVCMGAAQDAGLASFHMGLRELFTACLWGDPRRARLLLDTTRPRRVDAIADELTCLARRLRGLGLQVCEAEAADALPRVQPNPEAVLAVAGPLLERIIALEGQSPWVIQACRAMAADPSS